MRVFLSQHECAVELEHTDIVNYIRRYDKDVDGGLKFVDLVNALQTMTNYHPKNVESANEYARQQEENRKKMEQHYANTANEISAANMLSSSDIGRHPNIQIEDMGGVTNLTNNMTNSMSNI